MKLKRGTLLLYGHEKDNKQYCEEFYSYNFDNLDELDQFLER